MVYKIYLAASGCYAASSMNGMDLTTGLQSGM
jgi:hypothetical protein